MDKPSFEAPELQLPAYKIKRKWTAEGWYLFDAFRKKWLHYTPEEWVRQHLLHYLVEECAYPPHLLSVERNAGLQDQGRYDALWYDRKGQAFLLLECKAPSVALRSTVVLQSGHYAKQMEAPYVLLSNGRAHLAMRCSRSKQKGGILQDIPPFPMH